MNHNYHKLGMHNILTSNPYVDHFLLFFHDTEILQND